MKSLVSTIILGTSMGLAVVVPAWIARHVSSATAQREAQESRERVIRWTRKNIDALSAKHQGEPWDQWPEIDRFAYESMRRSLRDMGEELPQEPD